MFFGKVKQQGITVTNVTGSKGVTVVMMVMVIAPCYDLPTGRCGNGHHKWGNEASNYPNRHVANPGHFKVAATVTVW